MAYRRRAELRMRGKEEKEEVKKRGRVKKERIVAHGELGSPKSQPNHQSHNQTILGHEHHIGL